MLGPQGMAVLVVVVMLAAFCYISDASRQAAEATNSFEKDAPQYVNRVESAIQETEQQMVGDEPHRNFQR